MLVVYLYVSNVIINNTAQVLFTNIDLKHLVPIDLTVLICY